MMELPCGRPTSELSAAQMDTKSVLPFSQTQPQYRETSSTLINWSSALAGNREFTMPTHQTSMPMEWLQQIQATMPSAQDTAIAASPSLGELEYVAAPADWQQSRSFDCAGIRTDGFEPVLSQPSLALWDPGAIDPALSGLTTGDEHASQRSKTASYPLTPLLTGYVLSTNWQDGELAAPAACQPSLAGGYEFGHDRRRTVPQQLDTEETRAKKRGYSPLQTQGLDLDPLKDAPTPRLRRYSTDTSYSASPAQSATSQTFDPPNFNRPNDDSDTTTTTTATIKPKRTRTRRASRASTTTTTTTTPPPSSNPNPAPQKPSRQPRTQPQPKSQAHKRNRNRVAASRHRAKAQAASAQLEAEERALAARHRTLLLRVAQLREEVYRLKDEVLRQAGGCCGRCPLMRGYLRDAAGKIAAGLRAGPGKGFLVGDVGDGRLFGGLTAGAGFKLAEATAGDGMVVEGSGQLEIGHGGVVIKQEGGDG